MSKADTAPTTITGVGDTSRRSFLSVAGGLTAGLCLPWDSSAKALTLAETTPIQRLWMEREAIIPELKRLAREEEEAAGRWFDMLPPVPEEMRMFKTAAYATGMAGWHCVGAFGDRDVAFVSVEGWRHAVNRPLTPAEEGPMAHFMAVTHQRARARAILPIAERYEAAVNETHVASGHAVAGEAYDSACYRLHDIERAIFDATPETFADLLIQAETCEAAGYTDEDASFPAFIGRDFVRSIKALTQRPA